MTIPHHGINADRKTPDKIQFIIDNHEKMTRQEMADHLGESFRWIKRQIKNLVSSGRIIPKIKMPEKLLTESDWTEEVRFKVRLLRCNYLKKSDYILKVLNKDHGLKMTRSTFQFWVGKLGLPEERIQDDWLTEYLPKNLADKLLGQGLRIIDIKDYIEDNFGVVIGDDILLAYIKRQGLLSQKLRYFKSFEDRAKNLPREWLENKILDRAGMNTLVKASGLSHRVLKKKLESEQLNLLPRRKVWSENMELIRNQLMDLELVKCDQRHEMLLGWLLGDGHIDFSGRFTINHSVKQLGYFYVKVRILRDLITNITTVPRQEKNSEFLNSKEQFGLEMYGMEKYLEYLNPDGSKNYEKILSEMTPLGLACYYMDDGSWVNIPIMCMNKEMAHQVQGRFWFKSIENKYPEVTDINPEYILPYMAYKLPTSNIVGRFWEGLVPECFHPVFRNDLDLCLANDYLTHDGQFIHEITDYYHKRGFPYYHVSKDYLLKQWDDLNKFDTVGIWKGNILRYTTVGNIISENFMDHMVEARHGSYSPLEVFNSSALLSKSINFLTKTKMPPIPDLLYKSIIYSNKSVTGFSCAIAKAIINRFSSGPIVVDPCAGWGGRMVGTLSLPGKIYHGFEPWNKTSAKLKDIANFLRCSDRVHIYEKSFDQSLAPTECHCILTSPPYVDLEIYGNKMNMEEWDELIHKIFDYADRALVQGGMLILNIPSTLLYRLPSTSLKRDLDIFWCSAAKQKNPTESLYTWRKA